MDEINISKIIKKALDECGWELASDIEISNHVGTIFVGKDINYE